ncbi:tRNA (adenosine(37)-N6)-threonylcarbamoyltransferase complex ATPase subunit type 1 TsaE [Patescibacteria group bacterium]|nr:tRNA (adenosine(37)-N6)-threonylcarbamoyltransferase complex ATPase subunit type 1 TsaE [Patescibacteria group bacterium]
MKKNSNSKMQTQKIAKDFAKKTIKHPVSNSRAMVIGLSGDLGSGKTTFVQGFAKSLGIKERVISPTFVLMKKFKIKNSRFKNLIHFDIYRINNSKEIIDLGWKEMIKNPENIILVEWAEKIKKLFSKPYFCIEFIHRKENQRGIDIRLVK